MASGANVSGSFYEKLRLAGNSGGGIADAWELIHFGNLTTANVTSDYNGDGISDLQAYLEGADPLSANGALRVTGVSKMVNSGGSVTLTLTFATTATRLYRIETSPTLFNPAWADAGFGVFTTDSNTTTTRQVTSTNAAQ